MYYQKYIKYKQKYLKLGGNKINYQNYNLIAIGNFSHGDTNTWEFRLEFLKRVIQETNKNITVYIEDTPEHTTNIMTHNKLIIDKEYNINEDGYPYGPLWRYSIRSWDSPIYLEIIKYIRANKSRINIIGIDVDYVANRDKVMSNNILKNLNISRINFLWMANDHVDARLITEKYEDIQDIGKPRCGKYIKDKLKNKYLIILTTGYKGEIRFNSICNNDRCDKRTWSKIPIFEKFKYNLYKKYKTNNKYDVYNKFIDNILEYADSTFPNNSAFVNKTNTYDYIVFFSKVKKLELIK